MATQTTAQAATKTETKSSNENPNPFLSDDLRLSMWIPAELAGKVIGKKGIVISNIKRESQANFITAMQPVGDSLWAAVVILGSAAAVFTAYKAVANMVDNEVDDVILEFEVSKTNKHAYLTNNGINNQLVRKLSAETNVRIFIPNFGTHPHSATLEGDAMNVQKAFQLLVKLRNNQAMQEEWSSTTNITTTTPVSSSSSTTSTAATTSVVASSSYSSSSSSTVQKKSTTPATTAEKPVDKSKRAKGEDTKIKASTKKTSAKEKAAATTAVVVDKNVGKVEKDTIRSSENIDDGKNDEEESINDNADENAEETTPSTTPRVYIEKLIDIPSTLVGLLLARRPDPPGSTSFRGRGRGGSFGGRFGSNSSNNTLYHKNVINQIQTLTRTMISRTSGSKKYVKSTATKSAKSSTTTIDATVESTTAEGVNVEGELKESTQDKGEVKVNDDKLVDDVANDNETVLAAQDSDGVVTDEKAETEGVSEDKEKVVDEDTKADTTAEVVVEEKSTESAEAETIEDKTETTATEGDKTEDQTKATEGEEEEPPVTFKVSGTTQEQVDLAIEYIQKIINGERIKDAIADLKIKSAEMFPSRYSISAGDSYTTSINTTSSIKGGGRFSSSRGDSGRGRGRDGRGRGGIHTTDSTDTDDAVDVATSTNTTASKTTGGDGNDGDNDDDNGDEEGGNNSRPSVRRPRISGGRFRVSGGRRSEGRGSSNRSGVVSIRSKAYTKDARNIINKVVSSSEA